ncbi:MAG: fumarate reductase subunit FrdD [Pseudomonadales bacterium]|jgi:fumarate reductase subunit D|nr:fumarate reductase subunit FrdD [Pseudomonadales bacterium]MDP6471122.1 fumarate reductase subunit FrdD [Pseudomonadales bacterium]MDP6825692.1 fumarate reductase subunit FrdD [Pseudomonadales bacterium]MDP6973148.1 fumarate reductase subunit FrdD [Pseudomonadales bacterium]|tara:strand:+ start:1185 stop:1544 length:360 start_codon:yes stop_codon:yes gene_type:complete
MQTSRRRSSEPIFWSLFGAGGVIVAFVLPVVILITGIAVPLGVFPSEVMNFERAQSFAASWIGKLSLLVIISLTLWHSVHRIYLSLHDLGIQRRAIYKWLCYGVAFAGTVAAVVLLLRI